MNQKHPSIPPAQTTADLLLMRLIGIALVLACVVTQAWVFVPFALAYMFRDWFAAVLYAHTTPGQRALVRFAQYRLMASATAALYTTVILHRGWVTTIVIFLVAWIDVIFKLLSQPATQAPTPPALPAEVTRTVTGRRGRRIRP